MAGRGGNGDTLPQRDPNTFISNGKSTCWNGVGEDPVRDTFGLFADYRVRYGASA